MKRIYMLFLALTIVVNVANAQTETEAPDKKKASSAETNEFYYFEIPSAINGSNLDPSAISNISSSFTDSKLSLKLGFPSFFKDDSSSVDLKNTGFIQPYAKATNGLSTLWNANSRPVEFGVTGGYSRIISHNFWLLVKGGKLTDKHASEAMQWLNIIGTYERGNYNLFNSSESFGNLMTKRTDTNGGVYVTFNRYFFSRIKRYRIWSQILSVGVGYAKTNNYTSLKSRTLQEGRIVYNADNTVSQVVTELTAGRSGNLEVYKGLTGFGELFIPLVRNNKYGSIYFGNQISYYGIAADNHIINGTTGFYFNIKDKKLEDVKDNKIKGGKVAKDVVNFSVVAQFRQLNKVSEENYKDNNFSVLLQAAVPIRFN